MCSSDLQALELHTRGWLPYTMRWQATTIEIAKPIRLSFETTGNFAGLGIWTLWQHGPVTLVRFNWKFRADKAFMRWFWWILRPLLSADHRWAMARGEEALRRELGRENRSTDYTDYTD